VANPRTTTHQACWLLAPRSRGAPSNCPRGISSSSRAARSTSFHSCTSVNMLRADVAHRPLLNHRGFYLPEDEIRLTARALKAWPLPLCPCCYAGAFNLRRPDIDRACYSARLLPVLLEIGLFFDRARATRRPRCYPAGQYHEPGPHGFVRMSTSSPGPWHARFWE